MIDETRIRERAEFFEQRYRDLTAAVESGGPTYEICGNPAMTCKSIATWLRWVLDDK